MSTQRLASGDAYALAREGAGATLQIRMAPAMGLQEGGARVSLTVEELRDLHHEVTLLLIALTKAELTKADA